MAAFMSALESDLRALSAEARRRYPAVKDAAEHAILKLRSLASPDEIVNNQEIPRIFVMACEVKNAKLSVIGMSCLQKLVSHDAIAPSAVNEILTTLKEHSEMMDESIHLKTLQTILVLFQSRLQPDDEDNVALALGICLRLLESNRSSDSVKNTAAATFRQAVALIFDHVIIAESLPVGRLAVGGHVSRSTSITSDVNHNITRLELLDLEINSNGPPSMRDTVTEPGKLGLHLLEDLTSLAAGGSGIWLRFGSIHRSFALELLEFILSNYAVLFKRLISFEQVLRYKICSLLMTSLRTNSEIEGDIGEPFFRRLVLRSVAHIIKLYCSSLTTESEVFLSMLIRLVTLDLPLWHRILVLEILRGFCVESRTLRSLFQNFDHNPNNSNVIEDMVKALARVVSNVQYLEFGEESLAAVAGMFSSKARGVEWILDSDASNATVLVASEAHAITLAIEGLLGVVFAIATLTDEAVDDGELESPRCYTASPAKCIGRTAVLCMSMVESLWLIILDALSLILMKSQGEAIILEILKGYQAFTQACGVLHAIEPLNSFLASLCKFTIHIPIEVEKRSVMHSPSFRRSQQFVDQKEGMVLTPKNVQALRTLFNIAHRLQNVLGPSWVLVLETLSALDQAIHSPHASTQEVSSAVLKANRDSSGQYSDFSILSSLNSQLFESSASMHLSAVHSLLSALRQLSHQYMTSSSSSMTQTSNQKFGIVRFCVDRMLSILINNLHRIETLWGEIAEHFLALCNCSNTELQAIALAALDKSICAVLGSDHFHESAFTKSADTSNNSMDQSNLRSLERIVMSPLHDLYSSSKSFDVRIGSLKILLHVLERHGERLRYSWLGILKLLRSIANSTEKDLITLGFQSLRVVMNDGLPSVPAYCLHECIEVTGAFSTQKTELNISLTAVGLLWTATDFFVKGLAHCSEDGCHRDQINGEKESHVRLCHDEVAVVESNTIESDKLLFSVFSLLHKLGSDERPEVRNSAVKMLFQTLGGHGQKLSSPMWEDCLKNYVFPILNLSSHLAATSSKDEWHGKELGTQRGKAVHMLVHHSRNTAQKQWDETLVLVLGGISRILRSFFPFLINLHTFQDGWESLLLFLKSSILGGSKEVALAAINCLQSTVLSHSPKGNLPAVYLKSVLDIYEAVLQQLSKTSNYKVKQDIIHGLGELYTRASTVFTADLYKQLILVVDFSVRESESANDNFEAEYGHVPPLQRAILEILPLLRPTDQLSSMWVFLLRALLRHLPAHDALLGDAKDFPEANDVSDLEKPSREELVMNVNLSSQSATKITSSLFMEKLVPIVVELFLQAPVEPMHEILPDLIHSLRRCMTTRRDDPDGKLWRVAVKGFQHIMTAYIRKSSATLDSDVKISKTSRTHAWRAVADMYEIFLVGQCGRALPSNVRSEASCEADESLEMNILDFLGQKLLGSEIDIPLDVAQRLVCTLDQCASRTSCLPIETVELMPAHCSRFSLTCLQKLFSLSSCETGDLTMCRYERSRISIRTLNSRCDSIIGKFCADENTLGGRAMPSAREDELVFVLQQLASLVIHPETASYLPLPPQLQQGNVVKNLKRRTHLLVLFPSICELVTSRIPKVRELVQVVLRLTASELGLEKEKLDSSG